MVSFDIQSQRYKDALTSGVGATKMVQGFNALTVHPGQQAAAQKAAYLSGVQRSVNKWATNVATKHDLQDLKNRMASKGANNWRASAATAAQAYNQNARQWHDITQNAVMGLPPRGDKQANIARMVAFVTAMNQAAQSQYS